jgi:predicted 2-oxoglutarate/Fe(II)-dependent dioxygenase YbiX
MPNYRNCFDFKWKPSNWGNKRLDKQEQKLVDMYNAVYHRQLQAVTHYCSIFNIGELKYWESTNFVKYGVGQHFAQHVDHGYSYNCTVSLVGWANDDYEGGELEFGMWGLKIKPKSGDLLISPSNYMYPHASLPVLSGTKYSLVTMLDYSEKYHTSEFMLDFYG